MCQNQPLFEKVKTSLDAGHFLLSRCLQNFHKCSGFDFGWPAVLKNSIVSKHTVCSMCLLQGALDHENQARALAFLVEFMASPPERDDGKQPGHATQCFLFLLFVLIETCLFGSVFGSHVRTSGTTA